MDKLLWLSKLILFFCLLQVEALKEILDQELGFVPETTTLNPRKKVSLQT